jgi:hypothetical protein
MNRRVMTSLVLAFLLASISLAAPASAARPPKTAAVDLAFTMTDGHCYAVMTASWSGYQVNRVRFLGYLEGRSGDDATWLDTKSYPKGESHSTGSFTSTSFLAARPGEGWYAYAIIRSSGGARLAEVSSPVVYAPAECLYP